MIKRPTHQQIQARSSDGRQPWGLTLVTTMVVLLWCFGAEPNLSVQTVVGGI